MAQVFVIRNDLLIEDAENPVRVIAAYPDTSSLAITAHGAQCTMLLAADNTIKTDPGGMSSILVSTWRDDYKPVINAEANRRINLVFPDFRQRNYLAAVQDYIMEFGSDATTWPSEAKTVKVEYDRGWQYIESVRAASNAWTAMPVDPTADSIWPTVVPPIQAMAP